MYFLIRKSKKCLDIMENRRGCQNKGVFHRKKGTWQVCLSVKSNEFKMGVSVSGDKERSLILLGPYFLFER